MRRTFCEAGDQEHGLPGWQQRYTQLTPGRFNGWVERLDFPGFTLARERINVATDQLFAPPPGTVTFGRPIARRTKLRLDTQLLPDTGVSLLRGGVEMHAMIDGGCDILMITAESTRLSQQGTDAPIVTPRVSAVGESALGWFLTLLESDGLEASPGSIHLLTTLAIDRLDHLLDDLLSVDEKGSRPPPDGRLFRRARDLVEAEPDIAVSVAGLAKRLVVPVHRLRRAFLDSVGLGPGLWLRRFRLDRARRDLLESSPNDVSVTEIAMAWGFWHLGRFSAYYAELFGELPSRTARRDPVH